MDNLENSVQHNLVWVGVVPQPLSEQITEVGFSSFVLIIAHLSFIWVSNAVRVAQRHGHLSIQLI